MSVPYTCTTFWLLASLMDNPKLELPTQRNLYVDIDVAIIIYDDFS